MDYAFMMHEQTSWLFKTSLILTGDYTQPNTFPVKISFEKRIAKSFTLNGALDHSRFEVPQDELDNLSIHLSLESRWYYRMTKRIRQSNVARNMSDNYIALGIGYIDLINNYSENQPDNYNNYLSFYAKWGIQRRFLKHGHADLGLEVGVAKRTWDGADPSLVLKTYVELGMCFTKDKYTLNHEKLCPFLKCYEADNSIFKSNLSQLINLEYLEYYRAIDLSPHIAFERKIGSTPFSINSELDATLGYRNFISEDSSVYDNFVICNLHLEGRWYYDLRKRILRGDSGNGLSADYLALGTDYSFTRYSNYEIGINDGWQIHLATGWQRLFSKHMYYDIQVGVNYNFETLNTYVYDHFNPRIRLALGYRF